MYNVSPWSVILKKAGRKFCFYFQSGYPLLTQIVKQFVSVSVAYDLGLGNIVGEYNNYKCFY